MSTRPLEYCCNCDNPTRRAGQGEDSLYTDISELGPYCEDCWNDALAWREQFDSLRNENHRLKMLLAGASRELPYVMDQIKREFHPTIKEPSP